MSRPPWFPKYAQDWVAGTAHLSLENKGAYDLLLCRQWTDGLPEDHEVLRNLLGVTPAKFRVIWAKIGKHFESDGNGGLFNRRLEAERAAQEAYAATRSAKAANAARARWKHTKSHAPSIAPSISQAPAEHRPSMTGSSSSSEIHISGITSIGDAPPRRAAATRNAERQQRQPQTPTPTQVAAAGLDRVLSRLTDQPPDAR